MVKILEIIFLLIVMISFGVFCCFLGIFTAYLCFITKEMKEDQKDNESERRD